MAATQPYYYAPPTYRPPLPSTTGAYESELAALPGGYNNLNSRYARLQGQIDSSNASPLTASPLTYSESGDVSNAIGNLTGLAQTGGYSAQDLADLRSRGISPVRAVYANMQRQLNQARGLAGGYSPGFSAVAAKLARDEATQISQQTQNVNAGIAQSVAQNRLQAAPELASAAQGEERAGQQINAENEQNREATQRGNAEIAQQKTGNQLAATQGQQSLFGQNANLVGTLGNQALGAASLNSENVRAGIVPPFPSGGIGPGAARYNGTGGYGGSGYGTNPRLSTPYF